MMDDEHAHRREAYGVRESSTGSVANYRKQESSVSQVIDFLIPDFRI